MSDRVLAALAGPPHEHKTTLRRHERRYDQDCGQFGSENGSAPKEPIKTACATVSIAIAIGICRWS